MVWPWDRTDEKKREDPLRNLDPSLREFLKKESPAYNPPPPVPEPQQQPQPQPQQQNPLSEQSDTNTESDIPTLFQDGRYAHLWKTYQSQEKFENVAKSDQEKLQDAIDAYKHQRAKVGRAALENCVAERMEANECFKNGSWSDIMILCKHQTRRQNQCYTMQTKILKALGYMSLYGRTPEVEENIQMHADKLYQRMLAQEKATEEAQAAGEQIPVFPPVLSEAGSAAMVDDSVSFARLDPRLKDDLSRRLVGLKGEERKLEEKAIQAELQVSLALNQELAAVYNKQREEIKTRQDQGIMTVWDRIVKWSRGW